MDMSDYAEPLPTELEQIVDEARRDVGKGPAPRNAATGIADMQARIEYHTGLLAKLRLQPITADIHKTIQYCERNLAEAKQRLTEYQTQAKGQN
jgi:hypothetical protein